MDRTALWVSIVAAVFAGLAAVFAGWSAWASHRSASSAESSARSAAEAIELERKRRHHELTPSIELAYEGDVRFPDQEEGVWFTNRGPLDYTSVAFSFALEAIDSPIAGFELGGKVVIDGNIGPLAIGQRYFLTLRRPGEDEGGGTLHLRLTCRNEEGSWTIPAQVEIPVVPSGPFAAWG
jgi:hypothetical protein